MSSLSAHVQTADISTQETAKKPRPWWSTVLSFTMHLLIIALLWFAPSMPIDMPEVAPPESIDATILPPTVDTSNTVLPPTSPTEPTNKNTAQHPNPQTTIGGSPSSAPNNNASNNAATGEGGTQIASGDGQSSAGKGGQGNKKLPSGAPVAVAPSGGFQIDYDLDASGANNANASGGARLVFSRKGDRYVANLNAKASTLFLSAKINSHSEGVVRENTLATERFSDAIDTPRDKWNKQSSFVVDYANKQVIFTNKGNTITQELTHDALFDYVSAMAYLQAGFQQGKLSAGQGVVRLPIGKRQEIDNATISISEQEHISTKEIAGYAIPALISINSGSIKYIRVWFVADKNYLPLKMEVGIDKFAITLLSRSSS